MTYLSWMSTYNAETSNAKNYPERIIPIFSKLDNCCS